MCYISIVYYIYDSYWLSFFGFFFVFFFKQKTAYEMRISDWSSDVCSSDLLAGFVEHDVLGQLHGARPIAGHVVVDIEERGHLGLIRFGPGHDQLQAEGIDRKSVV